MEIKQYGSKQPTGYWRNQKGNQKKKKTLQANNNENNNSKPMESSKSSCKREVYSNTILPQEQKTPNRQPNFTPRTTGKRRTKITQN